VFTPTRPSVLVSGAVASLGAWLTTPNPDAALPAAASAEMRAAYHAEDDRTVRRGAIIYCLLGAAVILVSIPLDRARFTPEVAAVLLRIRLLGALALGGVLAVVRSRLGDRLPRAVALLAPVTAGAILQTLIAFSEGIKSPMLVSTNFVILGIGLLLPWSALWAAGASVLVVAIYVTTTLAQYGDALIKQGLASPLGWRFFDNLMVFTASCGVAVATSLFLERRRARLFADRWALAAASREARETSQRYRSVVDTAGSAILVVSPDGSIVEFNREAERVLGWAREEALGRHYSVLNVPVSAFRAPDRPDSCSDHPTHGLEVRLVAKDGSERTLACNTSPLRDEAGTVVAVVVCAQDITDRTRAEDALRESEARLRTVIANAPVILFTTDVHGVVTMSEGRGLERLGLSAGDATGKHIIDASNEVEDHGPTSARMERYVAYVGRALAGESVSWQGSIRDATFECRLTPIRDAAGRISGVLGIALDLTERQQAEDARIALERKLLETQKLESLGVLAGGIAHDFNNLLMSVIGNASLAAGDLPADSPARRAIEQIELAARRGSDLTRQMLAYAGQGTVAIEAVDVNSVVDEMKDLLRVSMAKGARTTCELASDLPPIEGDPTQVRQVVMNLITNASDALGGTEGTIAVRTSLIDLDATGLAAMHTGPDAAPGRYACIEVADTGCGMDAATLERIFDPFFSTKLVGRGLGLATVLSVVRRHRGALAVESVPGHGTTFRVHLPFASQPLATEERSMSDDEADADTTARTVLLVDDEDDVRAVTQHMLERLGCTVLVAADGREGVDVFRANAQTIDAVIVDLTLPLLNGEQAFGEIRRIRPDARVIMMSGYDDERTTRRLAADGLAGFLRKPFSVADLRATMHDAIGESVR